MANDNKEIGEIVKKCKILLLDIEGTTTSISFVKDKLFPYAEENVKQFLDSQWETDDVKEVVAALRKLALEDKENSVDGVVAIPGEDASKEDQIEGLVNNVKWQMSSDRKEGALKQLQGLIWKQGYESGEIKGHVYDDVSSALEQWRSVDGQKVYIYSSGSVQAQKLLFGQSQAGDLLQYINGHFDTAVGAKQEATSYTAIAEKIGVQPTDVLFLTDIPKEGEAARVAGFHVALVSREGNAPLSAEATDAFPVLHSLAQLTASNKRKTDPQDEQPAKVPKTDADVDVKSASETVASDEKISENDAPVAEEKMEVEESSTTPTTGEIEKMVDEPVEKVETIVEDVTESIEPLDVPMVEIEPVVIEADGDKVATDTNTVEMVDAEVIETINVDVATKSEESVIVSDKPKSDEVVTESNEVIKPDEVVKKPDEIITMSEEVTTKVDEVVAKIDEVLESTDMSNATKDSLVDAKSTENLPNIIDDEQKVSLGTKKQIETQVVTEKIDVAEETPPTVVTEIEEITADNLGDVAEMIDDLEPIVEEPSNEDMEDLQNVGEVLEKECDEILSKVQDVTNLDNIPLKPLLNPIVEESMETEIDAENMDSNDIVERILDSELELEMKQCNDIDLNTVSEITDDAKIEESVEIKVVDENKQELETNAKVEDKVTENNKEINSTSGNMDMESSQIEPKAVDEVKNNETVEGNDKKVNNEKEQNNDAEKSNDNIDNCVQNETNDTAKRSDDVCQENILKDKLEDKKDGTQGNEQSDEKMDTNVEVDSNKLADKLDNTEKSETNNKIEATPVTETEELKAQSTEKNTDDLKTQPETTEQITTDSEKDNESKVNGKATNGDDVIVNVNGDASNSDELKSRLSVENGKDTVNGSNGDSVDSEQGQGDKMEAEVSDIKVKTVATEEPRTDPIEQPTEA